MKGGKASTAAWDPGPPQAIGPDNRQHELWRHLQGWSREPARARNVWLAYGDRDRLRRAMPVIEPLLRPGQVLVRDGGHAWSVWTPALREVLRAQYPAQYQSMPLTTALHKLYTTARVYKDDVTLTDPNTGETWPTLGSH